MVRLVGVDLPRNKRIAYAYLYSLELVLRLQKKIIEIAGTILRREVMI
jgi:ribosomal protein S13